MSAHHDLAPNGVFSMRINGLIVLLAIAPLAGCSMPRSLPAVRDSGERAFQRGDYARAEADFQEYTERKPGDAPVQLLYAKTLLATDQPVPAVEHATLAYDQHPADPEYIDVRAQALFEAKRTDELYRFLRGLCDAHGMPADYLRLGQYTAKLGDADGAEHAFLTAAKVDGGKTPAPQLALADFYHSINDKASEVRRLRMALFVDPRNQDIPNRLRALGEIPGPSLALQPEEAK